MEENENKAVEAENIKENNSNQNEDVIKEGAGSSKKIDINKIFEFLKAKKKIILGIIIAIVVVIVVLNLIFVSPKEAVNKFVKSLNSKNVEKAYNYINPYGFYVFDSLDEDEYDDFWSEYKDFKDSDEYQDIVDEYNDIMEDMDFDEINDYLDDYDFSIKVNKINKVKKVSSHLYRVSAKIEISADDEEESGTVYFYVMKEGTKSYIVGIDSNNYNLSSLLYYIY